MQSMGSLRVGNDWATSLSLSCVREGNGNPLQCSCLKNPRDGGAWWAAVYGVAQSQTRLKRLSSSSSDIQWMSTESREAVCLLWAGLWWDREWWWWGSLSCLQERGRMWLTWTSCEWGNQRTRGEIHTRAGGSAHRPRVCSAGTGKWEFGPLLCLTLAGHPASQTLRLLRCKMGMAKGPCKDTLRNSNIYKTSVSISGRKFSLSGMSVPLKLFKAKVRSLLQELSFTDDLLMGLTLFDCRMGCWRTCVSPPPSSGVLKAGWDYSRILHWKYPGAVRDYGKNVHDLPF